MHMYMRTNNAYPINVYIATFHQCHGGCTEKEGSKSTGTENIVKSKCL